SQRLRTQPTFLPGGFSPHRILYRDLSPGSSEGISLPSDKSDGKKKKLTVAFSFIIGYSPKDLIYRWLQPTAESTPHHPFGGLQPPLAYS
ncbi:MAG: hypothetical protein RBS38_07710, partial [Bacteroidales bacterium]|nr:hypothetical protein [Bacteroidales bacterium]